MFAQSTKGRAPGKGGPGSWNIFVVIHCYTSKGNIKNICFIYYAVNFV